MTEWIWKHWPMKNYAAITLPWGVFYNPAKPLSERVVLHESKHIEQIKRLGFIKFYSLYLVEYVKNILKYRSHKLAYRNISFEIEARKAAL